MKKIDNFTGYSNPKEALGNDREDIDLDKLGRALLRRKKFIFFTFGFVLLSASALTIFQRIFTPVYKGSFTLLINDPINSSPNNNQSGFNESVYEKIARNSTSNDIPTLITLLKSPLLLNKVANEFELSARSLASQISIDQKGSKENSLADGILNINLEINDKKKGKLILESLSKNYLKVALEERQKKLNEGLNFLNKQAPSIENKTQVLQNQLADFRKKYSLLEPSSEGSILKSKDQKMISQLYSLQADRNRLNAIKKEIISGKISAIGFQKVVGKEISSKGLSINITGQNDLKQLLNIEKKLAEAKSKFTPDSTIVKALEMRLEEVKPDLLKNQLMAVDIALDLNEEQLNTIRLQRNEIEESFIRKPNLIKDYNNIEQKLNISKQNLFGLNSARERFQLEIAQRSVPWRVISMPKMGDKPIKPSITNNLLLGLILGGGSAILAGLTRDRFDHVFHQASDVEAETGLPLLGHIPHVDAFENIRENKTLLLDTIEKESIKQGNTKTESYQRFFYQEAFRNLFTSIRFSSTDNKLRSILITSSIPSEGKSLINIILAKTLSDLGERVLLVDTDLRKPQIHTRLGINNLLGISNVLTDSKLSIKQAIRKVENHSNWSVITAGIKPPDPTRLLSSERLKNIMKELSNSEEYDYILYDSPPVLGLSDSALLSENTDFMILLVSLDLVDRDLPRLAINRIRSTRAKLLGLITNSIKVDIKETMYGGYNYKSKYQYGYGYQSSIYSSYAEDDEKDKEEISSTIRKENQTIFAKMKDILIFLKTRTIKFLNWLDN